MSEARWGHAVAGFVGSLRLRWVDAAVAALMGVAVVVFAVWMGAGPRAGVIAGALASGLWLVFAAVRARTGALTAMASVSLVTAGVFVLLPVFDPATACPVSGCTPRDTGLWAMSGLLVPWAVFAVVGPPLWASGWLWRRVRTWRRARSGSESPAAVPEVVS